MNSKKKGMKVLDSRCLKTIKGGIIIEDIIADGCFEETTLIKTNSGQKMIKELDLATDQVWNPINQKWMSLTRKTVTLIEGIVYTVTTNQGSVVVTDNHPFMLAGGEVLQACELNEGDLLDNGGSGDLITGVTASVIEDYMIVHNLVFAGAGVDNADHFVEANGVVSGVLYLQDKVQHRTPVSRSAVELG